MDLLLQLLTAYPDLEGCRQEILSAFHVLRECFQKGGKLLVCGNGGSAADAEHIVGELMKGFRMKRPLPPSLQEKLYQNQPDEGKVLAQGLQGALPAISLVSQHALISAFANDVDPQLVFAQQVLGYGRPGDVLLGISTSGNARNVLYALQTARALGLHTIGMTGPSGGKLVNLCDVVIRVPGNSTSEIQERHLPVYHTLCAMLEEEFFSDVSS